jgi:uncharacterized protein (TIGR00369 family)
MKMNRLHPNPLCFGCGKKNPSGLGLKITVKDDWAQAVFVPSSRHQGPKGLVHGGLICTLLDEVMVNLLWSQGKPVVTAELQVRMIKSSKPGQPLHLWAQQLSERHGLIEVKSVAQLTAGSIVARGIGKFMVIKTTEKEM